jgi:hypothetical protein
MPRLPLLPLAFTAFLAAFALGCSNPSVSTSAEGGTVYVPYPADFCNYTSWTTYVEPDAGGDGVILHLDGGVQTDASFIHDPGGRIEYVKFLNGPPAHGATEFPPGTLIVKAIPSQQQVFAMAKTGGAYNPNGPDGKPLNWEWIELTGSGCDVSFVWQGATPPASEAYGGTPQACNMCHSGFPENDFVASPRIFLKDY